MRWDSTLRRRLKDAEALNKQYQRTIRGLKLCLWVALIGWTLTLASGIALWKITDRMPPPPLRILEPDFGWGYKHGG